MAAYDCAYCCASVSHVQGSWVDVTGGDCCAGDKYRTNANGVHAVFNPLAGFDDVCARFEPEEGTPGACGRCGHYVTSHKEI